MLEGPHPPTSLPGGRLLIFDNGARRGFSRLLEIDADGSVHWEYRAEPPGSFFSRIMGGAQVLPTATCW